MFVLIDLLVVAVLLAAMLGAQAVGRRIGEKEQAGRRDGDDDKASGGPSEGAVYAILGLLLAFTFSGAAGRMEHRYDLGVQEANAIGTAWLRIDVLPAAAQPDLRELFRQYVDARIEALQKAHRAGGDRAEAEVVTLQQRIWSSATEALAASGQTPLYGVVLQPINDMIDITTTRAAATLLHPPIAVFVMLGIFSLIGSLFAGYAMASKPRSRIHLLGFPLVLAIALFVITDFELPRFGLIDISQVDSLLIDLRNSMK